VYLTSCELGPSLRAESFGGGRAGERTSNEIAAGNASAAMSILKPEGDIE
jgi:hypothetical protein